MSLTRKMLKEMGIEPEKIDLIIEAHVEAVDALKEERDGFKKDAEKVKALEKDLETAKEQAKTDSEWKEKFEKVNTDFETFKNDIESKKANDSKKAMYEALLKESNVADVFIDDVMKQTDLSALALTEEGKLQDADKLKEGIVKDYARFIQTTKTQGANTIIPPANAGKPHYTLEDISKMSQTEINANWDAIKASL